jgi:hypothetical protein
MVVVDGARRLINRTVDILVTSVHQTPAGKMIFGRLDERGDSGSVRADSGSVRAAAAAAAAATNHRTESAIGGNGHTLRPPRPEPTAAIDPPTTNPYPDTV